MDGTLETCTAGAGSLSVEFTLLSRLLGDPVYESLARRSTRALWERRHKHTGLVGRGGEGKGEGRGGEGRKGGYSVINEKNKPMSHSHCMYTFLNYFISVTYMCPQAMSLTYRRGSGLAG